MPIKQFEKFLIIYNNPSKLYAGKYNFVRKLYTEGNPTTTCFCKKIHSIDCEKLRKNIYFVVLT